jgi:spore coat protein U-like protein
MRGGTDASGNQRRMISGGNYLPFDLYSDSGYSVPFGNWPSSFLGGGLQVDLSSNGAGVISSNVTIYGDVPTSANTSPPAAYSEYMAAVTSGVLQYGSTPSNGSCPTGSSTANESFTVYATVTSNCTISVSALNFGSLSSLGSAASSSGSINAQCTSTTPYSIGLNTGSNASGGQRRMYSAATGTYVNYGLFLDSLFTQPWSSASSTTVCTNGSNTCYLGTGTGSVQSISVYGQAPVQTTPAPGVYNDTVVVTLTY